MELFVDEDYTSEATVLYVNQVIYVQTSVDYNSTIQEWVVDFSDGFIQKKIEKGNYRFFGTGFFWIAVAGLSVASPQAAGIYHYI